MRLASRPVYDFCFLDGAHNWTIDGLAVVLLERLLNPGGWLLLDDLSWSHQSDPHGMRERGVFFPLSEQERSRPHVRDVFDLLVKANPAFGYLRGENNAWGWARKEPSEPRALRITTTSSLREAFTIMLLTIAARLNVSLKLEKERLRRLRGDPELVEREIEERAQEIARNRWIDEGYPPRPSSDV